MNKCAIAFFTRDRVELSKQAVQPLLQPDKFDLYWIDGSDTEEGQRLPYHLMQEETRIHSNIRGGGDHALTYALTTLFNMGYEYIGFVENDVLLLDNWFERNMKLFELGEQDGLNVGAASVRTYEDRILCQRGGYAVMHNLGAGQVIFTDEAAALLLKYYRNRFSTENRKVFAQLAGIDIGRYWAFQAAEHWLTVDWGFDTTLAAEGLASVAATPSQVEMIGQDPPLDKQGLVIARNPVEAFRNTIVFETFRDRQVQIREGIISIADGNPRYQDPSGTWTIFTHQLEGMGATFSGDWYLKWMQGFGPFAYVAGDHASVRIPVFGSCAVMVGGGKTGGRIEVCDTWSGFKSVPQLPPDNHRAQLMSIEVPAGMNYRHITVTALEPGPILYGITTREAQPIYPGYTFDHYVLPSPLP